MDAIIGLVGAVLGAAIVGLSSYFLSQKQQSFEKSKHRKELLLAKYEVIYKELSAYLSYSSDVFMQMIAETGYGLKFDPKQISPVLKDTQLKMHIGHYARDLLPTFRQIEAKQLSISKAIAKFIMDIKAGKKGKEEATAEVAILLSELRLLVASAQDELADMAASLLNA